MGNVTIDSKRDYGIDLLRILSMLMVVATHALGEGGLLEAAIGHTSHTAFVWLTKAGVACAVNVYGLISGYVGYSARHRPANLLYLWCQAVFYTLGFTVLLKWGQGLALGDILDGLCPVTKRTYWYLTAYFALFFLMPALNFLIRTLPKKELLLLNASCVFLFSLMPSILESDLFFTKDGYSCLWLAVLYLLGGTCRRLELFHKTSVIRALGVYLLCCFVNLIGRDVFLKYRMFDRMYRLFEYTAPLVLVSAIALLAAFAGRKLPGFAVPFVKKVSPLAFGVYLIHVHPLVYGRVFYGQLAPLIRYHPLKMMAGLFLAVCIVFFGCIAIDAVRALLFRLLRIRSACEWLGKHYTAVIDRIFDAAPSSTGSST